MVLVEDVVDTGLTLAYLVGELRQRGPASVEVCALIDKQSRRIVPVPLRFVGAAVDEPFVLGYGLDMAGRYRNLELIAAASFEAVRGRSGHARRRALSTSPGARSQCGDGSADPGVG